MIVSYSWLNSFFKRPLPQPEKLAEILTMHSFEVESVERLKNDWILNIDVLPDRAGDSLSHIGIARECAAILNLKMAYPEIKIKQFEDKNKHKVNVEIKDKNCKRYSARIISNVKVNSSPKWVQDKLNNCGINSINNIVDATNYVMLELGQPIHAFDYDKIGGHKIIVRHAKPNEKIVLLNNSECILDKKVMVIADDKKALAIAGIKGGKEAEVNLETKTIVIESANFDSKTIGQTARRLNLRTDASARFENHLDPNLTEVALNKVCYLISEWAKADVCPETIDIYPEKIKPIRIKLELSLLNKVLGIIVPLNEIISILNRLDIKIVSKNNTSILLEIPTFRQDLTIPENIIEEIGRINGYEKIPSLLPYSFLSPAERNNELFLINKIRDIFKELNYSETYNYSFLSEKEIKGLKAEPINNPVSSFFKYLRPSLIPQIENNINENLKFFNNVKIFEIGKIFIPEDKKIEEKTVISGGTSLMNLAKLKGELLCVLDYLGIKASFKDLELKIKGEKAGEIIIKNHLLFQIEFNILLKNQKEEKEYEKISYHPEATRDISGLIKEEIDIEDIKDEIKSRQLVKSVELFDIYKGKSIGQDLKSVSMRIVFQSEERTLDSETIDKSLKEIIKSLTEKFNWQERK